MKNLFAILLLILFISNLKVNAQENKKDSILFAKELFESIKSEDINKIIALMPTPNIIRKIAPEEFRDKSDKELIQMISSSKKFKADFDNICTSAKENKIDVQELKFISSKVEKVWEGENKPMAMTIKFEYGSKVGEFALSVLEFEGKLYFSEFLISYNVFGKLSDK